MASNPKPLGLVFCCAIWLLVETDSSHWIRLVSHSPTFPLYQKVSLHPSPLMSFQVPFVSLAYQGKDICIYIHYRVDCRTFSGSAQIKLFSL